MDDKMLDDIVREAEARKMFEEMCRESDEVEEMMHKDQMTQDDIRALVEARGKVYERFINALREAGLGSVAIEVLPDDEAEDDEDEHTERLENDHEATTFRGHCIT